MFQQPHKLLNIVANPLAVSYAFEILYFSPNQGQACKSAPHNESPMQMQRHEEREAESSILWGTEKRYFCAELLQHAS